MVSIAHNKSLCIAPPASTTRYPHTTGTLGQPAPEGDRGMLQAAKDRFTRQLAWNQRSITIGLLLGVTAVAVLCYPGNLTAYWPLAIAAAVELGFVPWYTSVASRRLRHLIALIELDLEEGLVRDGKGRVRILFGVCPVVEDCTTRNLRLAAAGRAAFAGLRPGTRARYRFATRSRLVLSMQPEECLQVSPEPDEMADVHLAVGHGDSFDFGRISERRLTWRPHSANRPWRFRQDLTEDSQIASVQASRLLS